MMSDNPILSFTIRYGKPFTNDSNYPIEDSWNKQCLSEMYGLIIGIPGHNSDYYVLAEPIRNADISHVIKCAKALGVKEQDIKYENIPKNNC
jgi:hypothetical protein